MLSDFGVPNPGKHHLRIRGGRPVPPSGAHRQGALASLPKSRKLSGPHPIAKPLTLFAHSRAEKIRTKIGRKNRHKNGQVGQRWVRFAPWLGLVLALLDSLAACLGPCGRRGGAPWGGVAYGISIWVHRANTHFKFTMLADFRGLMFRTAFAPGAQGLGNLCTSLQPA